MIWDKIKNDVCCPLRLDPRFEAWLGKTPTVFITPSGSEKRHWVIGPYEGLKALAGALRVDPSLRKSFGSACFGRRHTDLPPPGPQPSGGFRNAMASATPKPVDAAEIAKRQGVGTNQTPRRSDQFDVFADFYSKKTLEAHHIVEKSILGALGRNRGDLRNDVAPCVLVVAEPHQQLFTPNVGRFRTSFTTGMTADDQADLLESIYRDLYASMADLLEIARIIIGQVRLGKPC
jgi:hypothetical protein